MKYTNSKTTVFHYDLKILFPVLLLVGIGIVMIYSASSAVARQAYGSDLYYLKKQAFFVLIGIFIMIFGARFSYRYYRALTYPLIIAAAVLLGLLLFKNLGFTAGGSTRWLRLVGVSFQPSEFARLAVVIFLAYSLSKKQDRVYTFKIGVLPHVMVLGFFAILIMFEPDFGAVAILFTIAWIMMFAGGVRVLHLLSPLPIFIAAGVVLVAKADYRIDRILAFLDPWHYAADKGYQLVHSQMAMGTGGIWGMGIGNGYQKLFYLPEPHTDFIFAVIGEELGLVGVMLILGLYAIIIFQGILIARTTDDFFGALLAIGITTTIGVQVCINTGVNLGLLPPKGLALPFLSYGGTSLLVNMAAMGILMNISASKFKKWGSL